MVPVDDWKRKPVRVWKAGDRVRRAVAGPTQGSIVKEAPRDPVMGADRWHVRWDGMDRDIIVWGCDLMMVPNPPAGRL